MLTKVGNQSKLNLFRNKQFSEPSDMKKIKKEQVKIIEEIRLKEVKTEDVNFVVL